MSSVDQTMHCSSMFRGHGGSVTSSSEPVGLTSFRKTFVSIS